MFIIKYYTCKKYSKTTCKIYEVNPRTLTVKHESNEFTVDWLDKMLVLHNVKNALYQCCEKISQVRVLNNPL